MEIPTKTLDGSFALPVLGQGTWRMGGAGERDFANDDAADVAAIRRGIDAGLRHIDTAEMYASGHAGELVAEAIRGRGRDTLFLTDKVWKTHLRYDDVLRAAEGSLKRLGVESIDLYLIHQVAPEIPLAETFRALNRLQGEGVIQHIGVSNFSLERLRMAQSLSETPIAANQLHYNLQVREIEVTGLLEYCRQQKVLVIAWRPLRGVDFNVPLMRNLAEKYKCTPVQIALNWLISQPGVVTISRMANPAHLDENLASVGWRMEPEDLALLTRQYPGRRNVSEAVPLI